MPCYNKAVDEEGRKEGRKEGREGEEGEGGVHVLMKEHW